jgi:hypothetical protein
MSSDDSAIGKWFDKWVTIGRCIFGSFISRQDARVKLVLLSAERATDRYSDYVHRLPNGYRNSEDEKIREQRDGWQVRRQELLHQMHRRRNRYYNKVNFEILVRGPLFGDKYELWKRDWQTSAQRVLDGILTYYSFLRYEQTKSEDKSKPLRPSEGAFANIQAFYAKAFPDQTRELKQKFIDAGLPSDGFDNPYMSPPALPPKPSQPTWLFALIVLSQFVITLGCIGVALYSIVQKMGGVSELNIFGVTIKTEVAGVAFLGIGVVIGYFMVAKVLDKIKGPNDPN